MYLKAEELVKQCLRQLTGYPQPPRERLAEAVYSSGIFTLSPDEWPKELQGQVDNLHKQLTKQKPVGKEGRTKIFDAVEQLTTFDLGNYIDGIIDLYTSIVQYNAKHFPSDDGDDDEGMH
jgi:hypothetical protein